VVGVEIGAGRAVGVGLAGATTVPSASGPRHPGPAGSSGGRLRRYTRTTPGRLRLLALAVAVVFAAAGAAGWAAVSRRSAAVNQVAAAEPLVVDAQALDTTLAQADATATNTFLGGGIEPADQRALYQSDLATAARLLADAAERSGPGAAVAGPLATLSTELPVYAGLVDTARADNRQGFPVGAAYLRQASRLMASTILPAATQLRSVHVARLEQGDARSRNTTDATTVASAAAAVAVVAVGALAWLYRRTNRVLNVALVAGAGLALLALAVTLVGLRGQQAEAATAGQRSFASVDLLAQVRTAAFKAKGDESLTLIGRGNGGAYETDFTTQVTPLSDLLAHALAVSVSAAEKTTVGQAASALQTYLTVHRAIRSADDGGQFDQAVKLAVGGGTDSASNQAFAAFDAKVSAALDAAQHDFTSHITAGRHRLRGLGVGLVVVAALAAALALFGFQQRINEYR